MDDAAEFLSRYPPFLTATPGELTELAGSAQRVEYPTGAKILDVDMRDVDSVWVVRSGRVVVLQPDESSPTAIPIDVIETGGVFGFSAMLSGATIGFVARTSEPSVIFQLPGALMRPLFAKPAGLAFLADAVASATAQLGGPTDKTTKRTVGELIAGPAVVVDTDTSVRDAVREMTERGASCVVVPLRDGSLGIFTDSDLRIRVVAAGIGVDTPISAVMSAPAETVTPDRLAATVLVDMLERGLRHMPVVSARGEVLGVIEDAELHAASTRRSFVLRRSVALAENSGDLIEAARRIPRLAVDLFRGGTEALAVSAILSVVIDSVVRRALELEWSAHPEVPRSEVAWLTLGSVARREAMPSSDVDSALTWSDRLPDPADGDRTRDTALMDLAARVHRTLDSCGLPADSNGAVASSPRFARSAEQWRSAARHWLSTPFGDRSNPASDSGLIMSSLLVDGRVVWGNRELHTVPQVYRSMALDHPDALRLQLRAALAARARLRSMRDVLARRGGTFDLKSHAITPIVNLARWGGLSVGVASASTPARLAAASGNGLVTDRDVEILTEVFDLLQRLRLGHQIKQVEAGVPPGDVVVMAELSALERSLLGDGVREIAAVQRRVGFLASNVGVRL
ncbi:putative nucleotidyltransferase substrate binding domain-containing protein [Rhodococcus sp. G-MC3]|uniref:putative nucleotidyltransferase substrate binding domain-containing protein n=1 Tax=Rhodococcus sp. G-MC3 TaxID=3046209 RepID=UPI0024BB96B4|nr:putative nucleotidyltransferase substrate binding domain-containing protein [Rhodococcus sp. G-MC3]MDJ0391813.1 putative nucleotidyltransferase substrate binding domain-containing protein [Rhodococcus sp. G-MC3]